MSQRDLEAKTQTSLTIHRQPADEREGEEEESPIQRMQSQFGNRAVGQMLNRKAHGEAEVSPEVEDAIQQARGGGQALDAGVRARMESALGADFGGVRIHTDAEADALNRAVSARAFTTGQDIFFKQGEYSLDSSTGRELLAHELTHVVQQNTSRVVRIVQRQPSKPTIKSSSPTSEQKALPAKPSAGLSKAQVGYYAIFFRPFWLGQLDQLAAAEREFRYHLLALECLRVAKGPGGDPLRLAEFCRSWRLPLTFPIIGPTGLLRMIGKATGAWPSQARIFDPTGAINLGIKVIGEVAPLIGRAQIRNAQLVALDNKVVDPADQSDVGLILGSCSTPQILINRLKASKSNLERVWKETVSLAERMERIQLEHGLPEIVS